MDFTNKLQPVISSILYIINKSNPRNNLQSIYILGSNAQKIKKIKGKINNDELNNPHHKIKGPNMKPNTIIIYKHR